MRAFILLFLFRPILFLLTWPRVEGDLNIPRHGPAIIAANHNSHLDSLIILCQFSLSSVRLVRPVAAADHFMTSPFSSWFYRNIFGIIAIDRRCPDRGDDVLEACRAALSRNEILLIYPEGTRGESEALGPLKGGIARLSMAFPEAPVIPVYVRGTRRVLPKRAIVPVPGKCSLRFGRSLSWAGSRRTFMTVLKSTLEQLQAENRTSP